jgi:hypothetical protein
VEWVPEPPSGQAKISTLRRFLGIIGRESKIICNVVNAGIGIEVKASLWEIFREQKTLHNFFRRWNAVTNF